MLELLRDAPGWLADHPLVLIAVAIVLLIAAIVVPMLLAALALQVAGSTVAGGLRGGPLLRGLTILVLTAALLGLIHLWASRSTAPLLIFSEGPAPAQIDGASYDLTVEPDGSLLVTEDFTVQLDRDLRSPFRPLRRDQPATVLSASDNGRPLATQSWIGPQAGIRLGTGVSPGSHRYRLSYRLPGAVQAGQRQPERLCPPFSTCTDPSEQPPAEPVQRVRWRPLPWPVLGEQTVRWHFPRPYRLEEIAALNPRFTWTAQGATQTTADSFQVRRSSTYAAAPPVWLSTLTLPAGMTTPRQIAPDYQPSWPLAALPLLALVAAVAIRLRLGGTPAGLTTLKAEYRPPDELPATALGRLLRAQREALVAAALAEAVAGGVLRVDYLHRERTGLPDQHDDDFVVTGDTGTLPQPTASFVVRLLHGDTHVRYTQLAGYGWEEAETLESDLQRTLEEGGYFNRRRRQQRTGAMVLAAALAIGGPYATFYLVNRFPVLLPLRSEAPQAMIGFTEAALAAWILAALIVLFAALGIPTITRRGALARSRARGFAEYLRTAEVGRIEHEVAEGRASPLLSYALALGVTTALTERWQGITTAPAKDEDRRRRRHGLGRPDFDEARATRYTLLAARPATIEERNLG